MTRPKDPDRQRRTRTTKAAIARVERQARALDLRREGQNYRTIAAELAVSVSTAHNLVVSATKAIPAESVDQLRAVDGERTEQLWRVAWAAAQGGDPKSITAAIKVLERRAKLLGLDIDPEAQAPEMRVFIDARTLPNIPDRALGAAIAVEGGALRELITNTDD